MEFWPLHFPEGEIGPDPDLLAEESDDESVPLNLDKESPEVLRKLGSELYRMKSGLETLDTRNDSSMTQDDEAYFSYLCKILEKPHPDFPEEMKTPSPEPKRRKHRPV